MAVKHFHIATPDQLQALADFAKSNAPTILKVARIWASAKKKHEHTRWDFGVYVVFSGDRKREAVLARVAAGVELVEFGTLKYNLALNWCEQHLHQVCN